MIYENLLPTLRNMNKISKKKQPFLVFQAIFLVVKNIFGLFINKKTQ